MTPLAPLAVTQVDDSTWINADSMLEAYRKLATSGEGAGITPFAWFHAQPYLIFAVCVLNCEAACLGVPTIQLPSQLTD